MQIILFLLLSLLWLGLQGKFIRINVIKQELHDIPGLKMWSWYLASKNCMISNFTSTDTSTFLLKPHCFNNKVIQNILPELCQHATAGQCVCSALLQLPAWTLAMSNPCSTGLLKVIGDLRMNKKHAWIRNYFKYILVRYHWSQNVGITTTQ